MARAAYNVLVLPYYLTGDSGIEYCIFKRSDYKIWQFISGGGEDEEKPIEAAIRESFEEAGIRGGKMEALRTITYTPTDFFPDLYRSLAKDNIFVIPLYCFSIELASKDIVLSEEHLDYKWLAYEDAMEYFHYDVDRTALWELNNILKNKRS